MHLDGVIHHTVLGVDARSKEEDVDHVDTWDFFVDVNVMLPTQNNSEIFIN